MRPSICCACRPPPCQNELQLPDIVACGGGGVGASGGDDVASGSDDPGGCGSGCGGSSVGGFSTPVRAE